MKQYLEHDYHGGHCCGMSHVFSFANGEWDGRILRNYTEEEKKDLVLRTIKDIEEGMIESWNENNEYENEDTGEMEGSWEEPCFGHCIEVVLIDAQMDDWSKVLKEIGFERAYRFLNDNSGNYCNVLFYYTSRPNQTGFEGAPYVW